MARQKLKSFITSFTPDGEYFAILFPDGVVKIWKTSSGSLFAEWRQPDAEPDVKFSFMACSFVGKKRRKERGTCLLVLGSDDGEILAVDASTGQKKWKSTGQHASGIAGLSFTSRGHIIHTVHNNGMASEMNSETGELVREFKVSKACITSSASCSDGNTLAVACGKIRIFNWENGKELLKFSADGDPVDHISISDEAKRIITSGYGEKNIQVWQCDLSSKTVSKGPILSMRHPPIAFECKVGHDGEDGLVVLSVSESGVAYFWNLNSISGEEITPIKVSVKSSKDDLDMQNGGSTRKNHFSVIGARLHALETDGQVIALIAYGSPDSPQFSFLDIGNAVEDIVVAAEGKAKRTSSESVRENGVLAGEDGLDEDLEAVAVSIQNKKSNKKRTASDPDFVNAENLVDNDIGQGEQINGSQIDDDLNEPTMGEKLASLNLTDNNECFEKEESSLLAKPPSADSVQVLLKQALHADDRTLILNCLYHQDEKVIANSVSKLNPSDVLRLLDSLISIIQSRGAVLACALPWLRSLLLQHASGIMSQESSLLALNSLYQLIESRVSTFRPALQLSSCLELLYNRTIDDGFDENDTIMPVVYEDKDESEEDESEDAMETDQEGNDVEPFSDGSDTEGSDGMIFD